VKVVQGLAETEATGRGIAAHPELMRLLSDTKGRQKPYEKAPLSWIFHFSNAPTVTAGFIGF
jgi:hypothetical protein